MRTVTMQCVARTMLVCTLPLAACTTLQVAPTPGRYIAVEKPHRVWITLHDSSTIVVDGPVMGGDTVNGRVSGVYTSRVALLSDISQMQARRVNTGKTIGAVALVVGGIAGSIYLLKEIGENTDRTTGP